MIDRISRNFVSYSAYRQRMVNQLAVHDTYITRENVSLHNMNSRAIQVRSYHRVALEDKLIDLTAGKSRLELNYPTYSILGYVPGQVDSGYTSRGQHLDISA